MTDPRPYPATDWEEEQNRVAVDASDSQSSDLQDVIVTGERQTDAIAELIESGKQIQANAEAVEKLTRESLIADNKRFRRRNTVLVFMSCVMIVALGYLIHRDVYINGPEREKISAQTAGLQDANKKLDHLEAFVTEIEEGEPDPDAVTDEQLQEVFRAVFETRDLLNCIVEAPDDSVCAEGS